MTTLSRALHTPTSHDPRAPQNRIHFPTETRSLVSVSCSKQNRLIFRTSPLGTSLRLSMTPQSLSICRSNVHQHRCLGDGRNNCLNSTTSTSASLPFGSPKDPAILLLAGGAGSMLFWDENFCLRLSVRSPFDQRATGRSTTHRPGTASYTLRDFPTNALRVLDAFSLKEGALSGLLVRRMNQPAYCRRQSGPRCFVGASLNESHRFMHRQS